MRVSPHVVPSRQRLIDLPCVFLSPFSEKENASSLTRTFELVAQHRVEEPAEQVLRILQCANVTVHSHLMAKIRRWDYWGQNISRDYPFDILETTELLGAAGLGNQGQGRPLVATGGRWEALDLPCPWRAQQQIFLLEQDQRAPPVQSQSCRAAISGGRSGRKYTPKARGAF